MSLWPRFFWPTLYTYNGPKDNLPKLFIPLVDATRDAILTRAKKLTYVSLIYRTKPTTEK